MVSRIYKLSPLMKLLCTMLLANGLLLVIKLYAFVTGKWTVDFTSLFTLALSIIVMFGLVRAKRFASQRIGAIAATADEIIRTGDLSRRIPVSEEVKDVTSLTGVLNRMLDEIELLMHGARTASDNIAHDLRHPLTRLRNRLEEARTNLTGSVADTQQQLTDLVTECDMLLGTFQAILRISNIESARRHGGFREVNLNAVLQDVVELYEPVATEKHITVVLDAENTTTIGDKDLLFQALANLVDNAIKYTPAHGAISITLVPHARGGAITITDSGPGIADAHKPNVFQRFYRVDPSRSEPGSGLGLSLVNAIVKLHQGSLQLADAAPTGLSVTLIV